MVNEFLTKRKNDEIDMVTVLGNILKEHVDEYSSTIFLNNKEIKTILELNPYSQRIIINKFFSNLFYIYRSKKNKSIVSMISMLVIDGSIEDWFKVFNNYVLPFIKKNEVFQVVYN
jgi:hypothetical protein